MAKVHEFATALSTRALHIMLLQVTLLIQKQFHVMCFKKIIN